MSMLDLLGLTTLADATQMEMILCSRWPGQIQSLSPISVACNCCWHFCQKNLANVIETLQALAHWQCF
jgi:hypothetical protein